MRRAPRTRLTRKRSPAVAILTLASALTLAACSPRPETVEVPGTDGVVKSSATARSLRRAFDGAPPVIPHDRFGNACSSCHNEIGISVPGVGFAPPIPHDDAGGAGRWSRCEQCHVHRRSDDVFRETDFVGLAQDLRAGRRLHFAAPPVIPHQTLLRENCRACHTGPAAREEIRCSHPERARCTQCHVEVVATGTFARAEP